MWLVATVLDSPTLDGEVLESLIPSCPARYVTRGKHSENAQQVCG